MHKQTIKNILILFSISLFIVSCARNNNQPTQCVLTQSGIPASSQINASYTNTYSCTMNSAITDMSGTIVGDQTDAIFDISKECANQVCHFKLSFTPQELKRYTFNLHIEGNRGYSADMPTVTTTASNHNFSCFTSLNNGIHKNEDGIPVDTIAICNDSTEAIYPIIEGSPSGQDEWLQSYFQVPKTDIKKRKYAHSLYRVYVNGTKGLQPGESVVLDVPFFSQLTDAPHPDGTKFNEYIDWWNGGRVYIYDKQAAVQHAYDEDSKQVYKPVTAGITCGSGHCGDLKIVSRISAIYPNGEGLPGNDPVQLTEYTLAGINKDDKPYYFISNWELVDWDISYVDHAYLPIAMASNDSDVGYIGSALSLEDFKATLNRFLNDHKGWPTYKKNLGLEYTRIPSTRNLWVADIEGSGDAVSNIQNLWNKYTNDNIKVCGAVPDCAGNPTCINIQKVHALFCANYDNYQSDNLKCTNQGHKIPIDATLMFQQMYGWVPFNQCVGVDSVLSPANELEFTPANPKYNYSNYKDSRNAYDILQDTNAEGFDPYVPFIHDPKYLGMVMAYAYSVDDEWGNMAANGTGLVITVGGTGGLPNKKIYDPETAVKIHPGTPMNLWDEYGVCKMEADKSIVGTEITLTVPHYPCTITLLGSNGKNYRFTLLKDPIAKNDWSNNSADYIKCDPNDPSYDWCTRINLSVDRAKDGVTPKYHFINTQPPY